MNGCGIKVAHACPARSPFHTARPRGDYVTLPPSYLPYRAWYFIPVFWGIYTSSPWGLPQEPFGGNAIQTATPMISPWSRLLQNSITHSFPLPRRATSTLYYKFSLLKHHLMPPSPVTSRPHEPGRAEPVVLGPRLSIAVQYSLISGSLVVRDVGRLLISGVKCCVTWQLAVIRNHKSDGDAQGRSEYPYP